MAIYVILHLESRTKCNDQWRYECIDDAYFIRTYSATREHLAWKTGPDHIPVRGIPTDISPETKRDYEGNIDENTGEILDCTDFTWCNVTELENAIEKAFDEMQTENSENIRHYPNYQEWREVISRMKSIECGGERECRAIYWFY